MIKYKKIKGNFVHKTALINWNKLDIGKGNIIGPYVIIGTDAQHPREKSSGRIKIGNNNVFREFTTINLPTILKKNTHIGNNCYFMTSSHIDHDCYLENDILFSNNVILGGNTYIMNGSQFGINAIIHQGQVIGSYTMFGMGSIITKKLMAKPGFIYIGNPAKKLKKNKVGLIRNKIESQALLDENKRFLNLKKRWL
jgi:UDP-N-acetylglucosamine acyltransferase